MVNQAKLFQKISQKQGGVSKIRDRTDFRKSNGEIIFLSDPQVSEVTHVGTPVDFEWTIISQSRGFEPYGMVSWPQGSVVAPPPPFPNFFFGVFAHFSKIFMYAWGKKGKMLVF